MLDAFIIEKIRREKEPHDSDGLPLRIEISQERQQESMDQQEYEPEINRGVTIIDYSI